MSKQEIWFIINPFSGTNRNCQKIIQLIENQLDKTQFLPKIILTEYAGHGSEIAKDAVKNLIRFVVAVGGDGTVNEIAKVLVNSEITLGIIPRGSGNGLARELNIPTNPKNALEVINSRKHKQIDVGFINEIPFFCTAGIGFDAHCSEVFSKQKSGRGMLNYIKVGFKEFWKYKPLKCIFGGNEYAVFSMTFANARQFGNNAYIAPQAHIDDGFLDCIILNPMPAWATPMLISQLFGQSINFSAYAESYRGTKFLVKADHNFLIHFDGEPLQLNSKSLEIRVLEKALKVIV